MENGFQIVLLNWLYCSQGTVLFYNLDAIYSDKKLWTDPETFRPERFLNENGEIDQSVSEKITGTVFGVGTVLKELTKFADIKNFVSN